jgi:polyisoprenoid-binding protein YceI
MTSVRGTVLATGRWSHPDTGTCAGFDVRNLGFITVHGTVPLREAWVDVDASGRPVGVHAVLELTAIDTGNPRRDKDLRKPKLLDTEKHPLLTFEGGRPTDTGSGWTVPGTITARTSTPTTLAAEIVDRGEAGELTVRGTTVLDRRALGVRAPRFMIGRYVSVTIEAVFRPPA